MIPRELKKVRQVFVETQGLPADNNHDPSNIIYANGKYHLWVTQHFNDRPFHGYLHTKIMRTSSVDGMHWEPMVDALLPSESGFDDGGVLTANVMELNGNYYMIYSGIAKEHGPADRMCRIGMAVAKNPEEMFVRTQPEPFFVPSGTGWEGDITDDVTIFPYQGGYRLYFKGCPAGGKADDTKIGMATSDKLLGPYTQYAKNPLIKGHAFAIWPFLNGYLLLTGLKDGDEGTIYGGDWNDPNGTQSLYWSEDGLSFEPVCPFVNRAVGIFAGDGQDISTCWGVTVRTHDTEFKRYVTRFNFVHDE